MNSDEKYNLQKNYILNPYFQTDKKNLEKFENTYTNVPYQNQNQNQTETPKPEIDVNDIRVMTIPTYTMYRDYPNYYPNYYMNYPDYYPNYYPYYYPYYIDGLWYGGGSGGTASMPNNFYRQHHKINDFHNNNYEHGQENNHFHNLGDRGSGHSGNNIGGHGGRR